MKKYIKKTITRTETFLSSTTCDICKKKYSDEWGKRNYEVLETNVSLKTGESFPDGGSGKIISFDICPDCFRNRLIPALKRMGAEPITTEWDF